jgi:hypothetical protein
MNIFTKAMMMDHNMSIKNIIDWIVAKVDASFVDKMNFVVDASLLVQVELVDVLLHPILI